MTAKQMFEALGYDMYEIGFAGKETHFVGEYVTVRFLNENKQHEFIPNGDSIRIIMGVKTHKAIHQYMKEKGGYNDHRGRSVIKMNEIKVGDIVRILDNSTYPYLIKDKLAIVERIDEIGEGLLVKELEEPLRNKSWWVSITSVEKV